MKKKSIKKELIKISNSIGKKFENKDIIREEANKIGYGAMYDFLLIKKELDILIRNIKK